MKTLFSILILFGFSTQLLAAEPSDFEFPDPPKTKIMVLGTYHMANPGQDQFNLEVDDILSPKRQAEILEVVIALSKFRPTKIALESDYDNPKTLEAYTAYLARQYELKRNEIDQIGYRFAKMMGHETVYPVDYDWGMGRDVDFRGEDYAKTFAENNEAIDHYGNAYTQVQAEALATMTVGEYLKFINSEKMLSGNHNFYSYFTIQDGVDDWFPGPHMVANWYKRNLYIVHNLTRIAEEDGSDRILVIFGQGHAYLLKQFLDENPAFEVVDVLDYLPD